MENIAELINRFLVTNFNYILRWEERVLSSGMEGQLSVSEYHVIEAIAETETLGNSTMSEVAQRLGITVGTLTTAVKTLEKKGFVLRQKGDADRRTVWLMLSPTGKQADALHTGFHRRMVGGIMDCLDSQQLLSLVSALEVLGDWFASAEAEADYIDIEETEI